MKDSLRNIFFQLLRMGLWGEGKLSVAEPLSDEDWSVLYRYAVNHTVEGVIFDAFSLLSGAQLPPRGLRMKWTVRVDQIERHNTRMNEVLATQFGYFAAEGLKPILLKGQGVAAYYRNPLHRVSGDIDWYFEGSAYHEVITLLQAKGILVKSAFGFSLDYDWKGVHIEHHSRLFDVKNPLVKGYLKRLLAGSATETFDVHGQAVTRLTPELQIFQVNIHILKHLIGFGIGLRQICDAAVLYKAYKSKIDGTALRNMYQRIGILKWIHELHGLLVHDIGLPEEDLPFPLPNPNSRAEWMMDEIWQSGNFGFHDQRFENGHVTFVSLRPDGARRIWRSLRQYFKYAPQEVFFFPIRRATARLTARFTRR